MSFPTSKDAEAHHRIITHMNKDHQDSLTRFLEHYAHLSSQSARTAKLADMTLNSLTITTHNRSRHVIPLNPPMKSWSEARERMVAMDQEALRGLGRSNITMKEYRRPRGFLAVVFVAAACTIVSFSRRSNFLPGSWLHGSVLRHVPRFARFCYDIQPFLLYPVLAIHVGEALWMERSRLEKHNVRRFSRLWWKWVLSTFVEGVGAFMRFDRVVKEETERKEKARH
ncbi:MAG: hypothetical protein M1830_006148 [Pleopsidium flavum]|nr:MAG: hypothetical protein M1830_006148 [Pleopsidium flavum]